MASGIDEPNVPTAMATAARVMTGDVVLYRRRGAIRKRHDTGERDPDDESGEQQHQGDRREQRQRRAALRWSSNRAYSYPLMNRSYSERYA